MYGSIKQNEIMRTVTFLGLMTIGGALRNIAKMSSMKEYATFYAIILIVCIVMDVVEFFHKINKK
jgi:hypothetical protein